MKKIMFNEQYGLQSAVLERRKTMTRRAVSIFAVTTMWCWSIVAALGLTSVSTA